MYLNFSLILLDQDNFHNDDFSMCKILTKNKKVKFLNHIDSKTFFTFLFCYNFEIQRFFEFIIFHRFYLILLFSFNLKF